MTWYFVFPLFASQVRRSSFQRISVFLRRYQDSKYDVLDISSFQSVLLHHTHIYISAPLPVLLLGVRAMICAIIEAVRMIFFLPKEEQEKMLSSFRIWISSKKNNFERDDTEEYISYRSTFFKTTHVLTMKDLKDSYFEKSESYDEDQMCWVKSQIPYVVEKEKANVR